jgi:hypothetical protein
MSILRNFLPDGTQQYEELVVVAGRVILLGDVSRTSWTLKAITKRSVCPASRTFRWREVITLPNRAPAELAELRFVAETLNCPCFVRRAAGPIPGD